MQSMQEVLLPQLQVIREKREIKLPPKPLKPLNDNFEKATIFLRRIGMVPSEKGVVFVLSMFKRYGMEKVLALETWLRERKLDPNRYQGLIVWKLKQNELKKKISIY